ncbi:MAG TPA: hypothetical protein VGI81_23965 [Tepidisphaeraceae bacterium]|jgi:hypothetical protein
MDLLIDLIIYLIKQATKASETRAPGPSGQRPVQPPPLSARQVQAMQRTLAVQAQRTRPAAAAAPSRARGVARGPATWAQPAVRAAVPPVNQPPVPRITAEPAAPRRPQPPTRAIPGLKLPFLLGEVLAPPVGLREEEVGGYC